MEQNTAMSGMNVTELASSAAVTEGYYEEIKACIDLS